MIVLWRAENIAQYLVKGTQVYVEGRLQTRHYEKDGRKVYITEVVAEELILVGGNKSAAAAGSSGDDENF